MTTQTLILSSAIATGIAGVAILRTISQYLRDVEGTPLKDNYIRRARSLRAVGIVLLVVCVGLSVGAIIGIR